MRKDSLCPYIPANRPHGIMADMHCGPCKTPSEIVNNAVPMLTFSVKSTDLTFNAPKLWESIPVDFKLKQ